MRNCSENIMMLRSVIKTALFDTIFAVLSERKRREMTIVSIVGITIHAETSFAEFKLYDATEITSPSPVTGRTIFLKDLSEKNTGANPTTKISAPITNGRLPGDDIQEPKEKVPAKRSTPLPLMRADRKINTETPTSKVEIAKSLYKTFLLSHFRLVNYSPNAIDEFLPTNNIRKIIR